MSEQTNSIRFFPYAGHGEVENIVEDIVVCDECGEVLFQRIRTCIKSLDPFGELPENREENGDREASCGCDDK